MGWPAAGSVPAVLYSSSFRMLAVDYSRRRGNGPVGEREIEPDAREGLVETSLVDLSCVHDVLDYRDQFAAGAEGEIVVQVFVTVYIDLGREFPVAGRGYEEVDVCRPITMPAHWSPFSSSSACWPIC